MSGATTSAPARQQLLAGAEVLGVTLSDAQADQLLAYLDLLARWNKTYNLTAIRDPQQMLVQHLLDSLSVVDPLRRYTGGQASRLLDVGSGGGLPGVVLAIVCPELDVTCVDTVSKKASFIRQVAAELGLARLHAIHARVESLPGPPFQVITARAFASLPDLVSLTRGLVAPGGVWMAMKGQHPEQELAGLPADVEVFHVEPLHVPSLDAERCLIWMRPGRVNSTAD